MDSLRAKITSNTGFDLVPRSSSNWFELLIQLQKIGLQRKSLSGLCREILHRLIVPSLREIITEGARHWTQNRHHWAVLLEDGQRLRNRSISRRVFQHNFLKTRILFVIIIIDVVILLVKDLHWPGRIDLITDAIRKWSNCKILFFELPLDPCLAVVIKFLGSSFFTSWIVVSYITSNVILVIEMLIAVFADHPMTPLILREWDDWLLWSVRDPLWRIILGRNITLQFTTAWIAVFFIFLRGFVVLVMLGWAVWVAASHNVRNHLWWILGRIVRSRLWHMVWDAEGPHVWIHHHVRHHRALYELLLRKSLKIIEIVKLL